MTSNVCTHLNSRNHEAQRKEYEEGIKKIKNKKQSRLTETFLCSSQKRFRESDSITNSLSNNLISMGAVKQIEKYKFGSSLQTDRYKRLLIMLVKCMLPISIVIF